jgi:hypothetical protein
MLPKTGRRSKKNGIEQPFADNIAKKSFETEYLTEGLIVSKEELNSGVVYTGRAAITHHQPIISIIASNTPTKRSLNGGEIVDVELSNRAYICLSSLSAELQVRICEELELSDEFLCDFLFLGKYLTGIK